MNTPKITRLLMFCSLAIIIGVLGTLSLSAKPDKIKRQQMIEKYDADGDGILSDQERATARKDMPKHMNGKKREMHREMLKKFDQDGDGKLSPAEKKAARAHLRDNPPPHILKKYDTDKDGKLSEEERKVLRNDRREMMKKAKKENSKQIQSEFAE